MRIHVSKNDIKRFIYDCVSIQNPSSAGSIPLRFTPIQDQFFWSSRAYGLEGFQDYSVKPRQIGFSTENMAFIIACMCLYPGFNALWVSQDEDNARTIRRKWDVIVDSVLNSRLSSISKGDVKRRNDSEFVLRNGSRISFTYAGDTKREAKGTGRGDTTHFAVFTECAYWSHAREAYEALIPGLEHSNPSIVWDSTPNGMFGEGEFFYTRVMKVLSGYLEGRVYFWPWYTEKRYAMELSIGEEDSIKKSLTPEERHLVDVVGIGISQIKWRRNKISDLGDIDVFLEIYTETLDEAFRAPGKSVFSKFVLGKTRRKLAAKMYPQPIDITPFIEDSGLSGTAVDLILQQTMDEKKINQSRFYIEPGSQCDGPLILGVDTSEGVDDGDPCCLVMINREGRPLYVGQYLATPIVIADIVSVVQWLYKCDVYIEDQSTGSEVSRLLRMQISKEDLEKYNLSPLMEEGVHSIMIKNNVATRPVVIGLLLEIVNKMFIELSDPLLVSQAGTMTRSDDGKVQAANGCHDDSMLALAIAFQGRERSLIQSSLSEDDIQPDGAGYQERFGEISIKKNRTGRTWVEDDQGRSSIGSAFGGIFDIL